MRGLVQQGMEDGAFGLSSGLFYVPGTFTPTSEVIELAKVAGRMGGIYISHMRDEASAVLDSVRETIEIGEQGGLPTQVTHHKIIGKSNWGKSVDTLKLIDDARARGVDVTIDQYPYTASSTSIHAALMPGYALEGGRDAVLKRLGTPGMRTEIRKEAERLILEERGGGDPNNVQLARCDWDHSLDGKRLGDVTKGRGLQPTVENAADTALWIVEQGGCQAIFHAIDEDDLQRILRHPATMVGSDGEVPIFGESNPHPRSYGTFARVLGRYVRELKTITLEDAVRKMSALPAQRIGLADRGVLREGMKADIRDLRSGDGAGPGDLRAAAPIRGRGEPGDRQRPGGVRQRQDDRGPAWPYPLRPRARDPMTTRDVRERRRTNMPTIRAVVLSVALAVVAGHTGSAQTPGPPWPALTPAQRAAPCGGLMTDDEIRSLGRKDVLVTVSHDQPGSSICGWAAGPQNSPAGFTVTLQTAEWFASERVAGPGESFDLKRHGYDAVVGTEAVAGLGLEGRVTKHQHLPMVMVRRATDVVYVNCNDCTRDRTIAIARLAAAP